MHVFSFCIYGNGENYYRGLRENLKLIQEHYPDWHIFIYCGNDAREDFLLPMRSHPNTHWFYTGCAGASNMTWRFFAIDQPGVESMHVRDADSRCHTRDRWCIDNFMKSDHLAYTIRDSPSHEVLILGGLWGCRKLPFSIRDLYLEKYDRVIKVRSEHSAGRDQDFLVYVLFWHIRHSFASYGYKKMIPDEHYTPIDPNLPLRPYCGEIE